MKMIVTDLDCTLLRNDKTISPYTIDILRRVQQTGVKIAIATARPKRAATQYIRAINADAAILHNGAVIYTGDTHYNSYTIPNQTGTDILQHIAARHPNIRASVEIDDALYANFEIDAPGWENTRTDFTDLPNKPIDKMMFSADDPESIKAIQAMLHKDFNVILGEGWLLMAMHKNACKYLGVKEVAAKFNITPADVVAFGDDTNDVEKLKHCGIGVAVENAIDAAKAVADYVCASNEEDGVARWLAERYL